MPIAISDDGKISKYLEEPFANERELQACLERSPFLLFDDPKQIVQTVKREVILPTAGTLDLLLVDNEGTPIAVEVKLGRNAQSRREVVAQVFDYVSDLSRLTAYELDDIVNGALGNVLAELEETTKSRDLFKRCNTNLRTGHITVVIAVDEVSEDLVHYVKYLNEPSHLNVRLVTVNQFRGGTIFVPRILVSGLRDNAMKRTVATQIDPLFQSFLVAYEQLAIDELRPRGNAKNYRIVTPKSWPSGVHYEFQNYRDEVGIEVHLESSSFRDLPSKLQKFVGKELGEGVLLQWDPNWYKRGRLLAKVPKSANPNFAAAAMQKLIDLTRQEIEQGLKV